MILREFPYYSVLFGVGNILGGGFKHIFYFHSENWGR